MTRVNLVEVGLLTDQHLFAEYREITRIFANVKKACASHPVTTVLAKIPPNYRMGTGHVLFFYDKLVFIEQRYFSLKNELLARQVNITPKDDIVAFRKVLDEVFYQDYTPTQEALASNIKRLQEKISAKPNWYRYRGQMIDTDTYQQQLTQYLARYNE